MKRFLIYIPLVWFASCEVRDTLNKDSYFSFVEKEGNGLTIKKNVSDLDYSLTLCPVDYVIAKEFRVENVSKEIYDRKYEDLKGFTYFKLRISDKNKNAEAILNKANGEQEVKERLEYLSYGFEENIFIVRNSKRDTLPLSMYHFERTYGVSPHLEFVFSFKNDSILESKDKSVEVIVNDIVFNDVLLTYQFDKQKCIEAPKLKLY